MTEHADLESLSAYVDGEAPEWAAHVAACPSCRATADQLRSVAAAVGVPVDAPDPADRDKAVSAALGDLARRQVAERSRSRPRRQQWPLVAGAVAAMLAFVVGAAALMTNGTSSDQTTVAGPALEADAKGETLSDTSAAAAPPPTDLGEVADAATLAARVRPALSPSSAGAAAGTASNRAAPVPPVPGQRAIAPNVVGTRPCEEQARSREPSLREVVYFATARRGQVPTVVLGFSTGGGPVTLLMLAQDGCVELLRAAGP